MVEKRFRIALRPAGRRVSGMGAGEVPQRTFIGGMRVPLWGFALFGGWNVTYPLVKLTLFAEGLLLEPTWRFRPFRLLVPVWEARYEELSELRRREDRGRDVRDPLPCWRARDPTGASGPALWTARNAVAKSRDHAVTGLRQTSGYEHRRGATRGTPTAPAGW